MKRTLQRGLVLAPVALALTACGGEEVDSVLPTNGAPPTTARTPNTTRQSVNVTPTPATKGAISPRDLVPFGSSVYVEFASFDAIDRIVTDAVGAVGVPANAGMDISQALAMLAMFGVNPSQVLRDRPIGIAASLPDPEGEWVPTFILPVSDPGAFANALSGNASLGPITQVNEYVVMPFDKTCRVDLESARSFTKDLPEGLLVCRFAAGDLLESFGPILPMGLASMKAQAVTDDPQSQAFLTAMIDGVEDVVMALEDVDFVIARDDDRLEFELTMHMDPTSSVGQVTANPARDLAELARFVSEDDQVAFLASCDQALIDGPLSGVFEALAGWVGAEDLASFVPAGGASCALVAHVGAGETDLALIGRGLTSAPIERSLKQGLSNMTDGRSEVIPQEPVEAEQDGKRFLQTDLLPLGADDPESAERILTDVFGAPRARMRMLSQGDEWMLSIGEGTTLRRKTSAAPEIPADLQRALDKVDGAAAAFVYRVDYKWLPADTFQVMGDHGSNLTAGLERVMQESGQASAWATVWGGVDDDAWTFGTALDLNDLLQHMARTQGGFGEMGLPR